MGLFAICCLATKDNLYNTEAKVLKIAFGNIAIGDSKIELNQIRMVLYVISYSHLSSSDTFLMYVI